MFNKHTFYAVYAKPDADDAADALEFVPQGFSVLGFLFHGLYLLCFRAWLPGFAALILTASAAALPQSGLYLAAGVAAELLIRFWVGFDGLELRASALEQRGYVLVNIVSARNQDEAKLRYLDHTALAVS